MSALKLSGIEANVSRPFLKWAGGKTWLAGRIANEFTNCSGKYIEPFLGGGAVFFALGPKNAILGDYNEWLIETYVAIQEDWHRVMSRLKVHDRNHSKNYYYRIRESNPSSPAGRAAKLIYLNRACWNGLFRVDNSGHFNVPVGTTTNIVRKNETFECQAQLLKRAKLMSCDFEYVLSKAKLGDFIYADPPYRVEHHVNGFIAYNDKLFSWSDQVRLCEVLRLANKRGVKIVVSNAKHPSILELYKPWARLSVVTRNNLIGGLGSSRGKAEEYFIVAEP